MGFTHTKKAFKLPLPSREKFTLLGLCEFANNDDDTCYPGIPLLSEMTSTCERTVQRAINVLQQLEIIDKTTSSKGNNIYKLYLRGDIRSWYLYLKSRLRDLGYTEKDLQYAFMDSKSYYNKSIKEQVNLQENGNLIPGDKSPETDCEPQQILEEIKLIPPGKDVKIEKFWLKQVSECYDGLEPKFPTKERWILEDVGSKLAKDEIAVYEFLRHVIANWRVIVKASDGPKKKDFAVIAYPNPQFLSDYLQLFYSSYYKDILGLP